MVVLYITNTGSSVSPFQRPVRHLNREAFCCISNTCALTAQEREEPIGDVDLPDWAPGHKVKHAADAQQQDSRAGSDVDLPDWAPGHKVSRYAGSHPAQQQRSPGYEWAQDVSPPPDARHDTAARWDSHLGI